MTDSILVVGGGVAGLHAALECANAGAKAVVVEQGPVVGGRLAAAMSGAGAIGERAEDARLPLLEIVADNEQIEILTLAELESIDGGPGNFTVSIRQRARFVTDACTRCKLCRAACPVVQPNEFDAGLTYRKAIYTPLAQTLPSAWVIDLDSCLNKPPNYLPCQRCVEVCADDAIHFDLPLETLHSRHVGGVILAPGFQALGGARFAGLGYGRHPDILTSAELQRLLESPGPTGGYASKPSNESYPESVLLVLDELTDFSLYIVASQVQQLLAQDVETVALLVLSQPAAGNEQAIQKLAADRGVQAAWGGMLRVVPAPDDILEVSYEDFSAHQYTSATYDLVVFCTDVAPPAGLAALAQTTGVDLTRDGYVSANAQSGSEVATSRQGVFVAGCASGAKNIRRSVEQAQAAADSALALLDNRVLRPDAVSSPPRKDSETPLPAASEELRSQIEQLLYALIDRSDSDESIS